MHAAQCGSFALERNGKSTNETEFTVPRKGQNLRIKCQCANKTQPVRWFFSNGTEVPSQDDDKSKQVYSREKNSFNVLWIHDGTSPLEYVGVYRCMSNKTSINIVVTGDLIGAINFIMHRHAQ